MLLSLFTAWAAVICALMTAFKYIARKLKLAPVNRFFHKIHIPFGILLTVFGLIHGILAGNPAGASLSGFSLAPCLFSLNFGTACFVVALLLVATWLLRKKLKKLWMPLHRLLTVILIVLLALHLINTGITLPSRLLRTGEANAMSSRTDSSYGETVSLLPESSDISSAAVSSGGYGSFEASSSELPESSENSSTGAVTFSGARLKDGSYTGSAEGYNGNITLTVTVSGGKVTDIVIDSENETPRFFEQARQLLNSIIGGQSLEVDTVTGATYSSAGIIGAVSDALQDAVISGKLNMTEVDLSAVRRH